MFDPTIYENLKVVAEGAVYDLDLIGEIIVTDRIDQVDLAKLSRLYTITFKKSDQNAISGELRLHAGAYDLSTEILEKEDETIGCNIEVLFYLELKEIEKGCNVISTILDEIWDKRPTITQQISYIHSDQSPKTFHNKITLNFDRKIGEEQVNDLPVIVDHMVKTMDVLSKNNV